MQIVSLRKTFKRSVKTLVNLTSQKEVAAARAYGTLNPKFSLKLEQQFLQQK